MSKNPKVTIALAFLLTFLIGIGAGYLLRGSVQPGAYTAQMSYDMPDDTVAEGQDELVREGRGEGAGAGQRSLAERDGDQRRTEAGERDEDHRRYGRNEDEVRQRDRDEQDREWRREEYRRDREARNYEQLRKRLKDELNLSEETAEHFFSLLEEHRHKVRDDIVTSYRKIREKHHQLQDELEEKLSEILTEEQLEAWSERFAPKRDRTRRAEEPDDD
ncbi:hypothetical protein [Natronogracilivirga saccharolytica]|uniref:Uncharacterized protein n=1 Tax=Natronogracilivirga saccharolytica TaxID=2812953 RepID=A0A8J7US57_9BACT|nr:hypothetical protein [Natronogracilivirga saccharolytica]MBP3191226.1 hypothetical protein [Natronogracilivirga saccharolytica]